MAKKGRRWSPAARIGLASMKYDQWLKDLHSATGLPESRFRGYNIKVLEIMWGMIESLVERDTNNSILLSSHQKCCPVIEKYLTDHPLLHPPARDYSRYRHGVQRPDIVVERAVHRVK